MMGEERKHNEFEDDRKKWKIYFDLETPNNIRMPDNREDSSVLVKFAINRKESRRLTEQDIEKLKHDLKDLGKFRIIKQGREFLEK